MRLQQAHQSFLLSWSELTFAPNLDDEVVETCLPDAEFLAFRDLRNLCCSQVKRRYRSIRMLQQILPAAVNVRKRRPIVAALTCGRKRSNVTDVISNKWRRVGMKVRNQHPANPYRPKFVALIKTCFDDYVAGSNVIISGNVFAFESDRSNLFRRIRRAHRYAL